MEKENMLLKDWQETSGTRIQMQLASLEFAYAADKAAEQQKRQIAEALAFWRLMMDADLTRHELAWRDSFLSDGNPLIRLITMIEIMPRVLWRRILWRYNIDFQSRESFLRRLKPEQLEAIEANYADLSADRIPRAFSRWEAFTRGITVERLKNERIHHLVDRYETKSAWSYNITPFDFGFNAYPNGDRDDKAEFFVSAKKFFSVKLHENDFVVDKEFGGYWFLYRKARSNFAYRPNREVKLKPQICPGFWWTVIIHLLFWVVSPALAGWDILTIPGAASIRQIPWYKLCLLPLALFTPLWLLSASIRLLFRGILWFFIDWLSETATDYLKIGLIVLGLMIIALVAIGTAASLYLGLLPHLGKLCSLTLVLVLFSTIAICIYGLNCKENHRKFRQEALHAWYAQLILTALAFLVIHGRLIIRTIYHFFLWIGHLIVSAVSFLIASMMLVGLYWLLLILPVAILAATWALLRLPQEKQEKAFVLLDRFSPLLFAAYIATLVAIAFYKIGVVAGLVFLFAAVIGWLGAIWTMRERNPVRHKAQDIDRTIKCVNHNLKLPYGVYLRNTKLQTMSQQEQRQLLENATYLISSIFGYGEKTRGYFYSLVAVLDQATLDRFNAIRAKLGSLASPAVRNKVFWLMLDQPELSYYDALKLARQKKGESSERRERAITSLKWLATPFILAGKAIGRAVIAFVDLCHKLGFLYEQFNKRCPFIEESKSLRYR